VSAASTTQDTAVVAPAQSQAILPPLQEAAGVVKPTESSQAALEKMHDAATNPALLENITQIGQMKELGLDYGWGPTSMVEWVVEHMHVYTGTPWWGTIIASAIAMRVLMIYPFFKMSNQQARLAKVHPLIQKHMAEYQQAQMEGDKMAAQIASKQVSAVRKRNGIQMGWMFAPMIVQGVFGYGAFKLTRAMAQLPVPGFETGGFAWMMDLTKADPTYITPISMWFMMHFLARVCALTFRSLQHANANKPRNSTALQT
jgi:YidC/Oxa1 family membrane protein insertase